MESNLSTDNKEVMLYSPEEGWQLSIGSRDSSIYRNPRCDFDTESEADLLHSQQIID